MSIHVRHAEWEISLKEFCRRNWARKTRLVTIDVEGQREHEFGLPLSGISVGIDADGEPKVEIMLGGRSLHDDHHLVHTIPNVTRVTSTSSVNCCDSIEIESATGDRTTLDFGPLTALGE